MAERDLRGEVAVCLVDDDNAVETVDYLGNLIAVKGVARGVVRRAYPYQFGVGVGGGE